MTPPPPVYGPSERPDNYLTPYQCDYTESMNLETVKTPDFGQLPVETPETCVRTTMMNIMYNKVALLLKYFRLPVVRHHQTDLRTQFVAHRLDLVEDLDGHALLLQ